MSSRGPGHRVSKCQSASLNRRAFVGPRIIRRFFGVGKTNVCRSLSQPGFRRRWTRISQGERTGQYHAGHGTGNESHQSPHPQCRQRGHPTDGRVRMLGQLLLNVRVEVPKPQPAASESTQNRSQASKPRLLRRWFEHDTLIACSILNSRQHLRNALHGTVTAMRRLRARSLFHAIRMYPPGSELRPARQQENPVYL